MCQHDGSVPAIAATRMARVARRRCPCCGQWLHPDHVPTAGGPRGELPGAREVGGHAVGSPARVHDSAGSAQPFLRSDGPRLSAVATGRPPAISVRVAGDVASSARPMACRTTAADVTGGTRPDRRPGTAGTAASPLAAVLADAAGPTFAFPTVAGRDTPRTRSRRDCCLPQRCRCLRSQRALSVGVNSSWWRTRSRRQARWPAQASRGAIRLRNS